MSRIIGFGQWIKHHRPQMLAVIFWGILFAFMRIYMSVNDLTFTELANELGAQFTDEWYGPLVYALVYLVRPLIFFPASLLAILAGNIWGLWLGFLYGLFAGTLSALIPYVVGYWFSNDPLNSTSGNTTSLLRRFTDLLRANPFQAVLTMRLLYFPYDLVSVFVGNLRIPFIIFFVATALGNVAGTLSFVGIGAAVEGDITNGEVSFNPLILGLSVVMLLLGFIISSYLKRRQSHQNNSIGVAVHEKPASKSTTLTEIN